MAIILGVQICTTQSHLQRDRAGTIIGKMEQVLIQRRTFQITRKQFLDKWRRLRTALLITKDYQDLIERVRTRAGGKCEFCNQRLGSQVHHIEPVAFKPLLVLLDINCKWTCALCHPAEDKKSRMRARRNDRTAASRNREVQQ